MVGRSVGKFVFNFCFYMPNRIAFKTERIAAARAACAVECMFEFIFLPSVFGQPCGPQVVVLSLAHVGRSLSSSSAFTGFKLRDQCD